ncbi:membrane protein [Kitasatospora paracochleata]|uniref:Transmembrane protein n=1 Tax=Kitasatospora paracochleata TaxID=58354 RepID=A0ABT1J737_9ACTN|nr:hypothetical protein [Kitasatospora paracochleata]MCP2313253.1 hypothetical protein [Kitasatospora paracochleata]
MSNAPHLLAEDRPDFARILDEALRDATVRDALRTPGDHLNAEQLHTKAMLEAGTIAAGAAEEYRHYRALRASLAETPAPAHSTLGELSGRLRSEEGAGFFPVLTVLAPILAWSAALLLLLIGYALRAGAPDLTLGRTVVTAGWVSLAAGVAALCVGSIGLVLTAVRDGSATPGGHDPQLHADLADARRAWHTALRERALLPWLLANLDSEPALSPQPTGRPVPPDLLSPGYSRGTFSSPGFSSPGVEGLTDPQGRTPRSAEFTSPGYTSPDFTGPDDV